MMASRPLSLVNAAKQLGRRAAGPFLRQSATHSTAAASSSWSLSSPIYDPDTNYATVHIGSRNMSDIPRRRRPPGGGNRKRNNNNPGFHNNNNNNKNGGETKQTWRSHAVSLGFGNYDDAFMQPDDEYYGQEYDGNSNTSMANDEESDLAERVQEIQRREDSQRKRWLENAKPPVRHPVIDDRGRAFGRGGRKTASARVWIHPGFGNVVVNKKDLVDYFGRASDRELLLEPLAATETLGRFDITATVEGGGLRGQAGAIRHGLARALNHYNPDAYRPPLKRLGYLTRDPRKVERKKIGHLKARKSPQWVKR